MTSAKEIIEKWQDTLKVEILSHEHMALVKLIESNFKSKKLVEDVLEEINKGSFYDSKSDEVKLKVINILRSKLGLGKIDSEIKEKE